MVFVSPNQQLPQPTQKAKRQIIDRVKFQNSTLVAKDELCNYGRVENLVHLCGLDIVVALVILL